MLWQTQPLARVMCTAGTAAGIDDFVIQRKCDCTYRRKRRQSAIGTTLEIAFSDGTSKPLFDLGPEVSSQSFYEAELHAASGLVQETLMRALFVFEDP